jgi:hypothetical protein
LLADSSQTLSAWNPARKGRHPPRIARLQAWIEAFFHLRYFPKRTSFFLNEHYDFAAAMSTGKAQGNRMKS